MYCSYCGTEIDGVEKVSLYTARNYVDRLYYGNTQFNGDVYGVDQYYLSAYGYQVKSGRGFVAQDFQDCRKVVLVDTNAVTTLFQGGDPIGKVLELKGDAFTVVGVVTLSE